ncbi:hypothetical protein BCR33DRAFT_418622 [Rhizoclosmatium globosum]|uniref:Uncharacterized protein n=1 Tax=Rhizoclosmatium globosum TaxID=329046 RepID=A0A1Y2BWU3_9FUNG|nr:hypothetical protein BCR33DRAFT_418622 [Rhizoclosmatium globosum]|eukprot:ORY39134.1 hypothetical protein BCR33DRAFT_418622 [Rhizoclosmatium globosum]
MKEVCGNNWTQLQVCSFRSYDGCDAYVAASSMLVIKSAVSAVGIGIADSGPSFVGMFILARLIFVAVLFCTQTPHQASREAVEVLSLMYK